MQTLGTQSQSRSKTQGIRELFATSAQNKPVSSPKETINCVNCGDPLKDALVKMINAADAGGQLAGDWKGANNCGTDNVSSQLITTPANNPVEGPLADSIDYNDLCIYEFPPGSNIWLTVMAQAQMRYFLVIPQGQETAQIEQQMMGNFYTAETYEKFFGEDQRQSRRLLMNDVVTKGGENIPVAILGGGPITSIFIVQESLYDKRQDLYLTLSGCDSIESYFLKSCASSVSEEEPPPDGGG